MKSIWITSLDKNPELVTDILATCKKYGLNGSGHFWTDDLKKMAWMAPKESLFDKNTAAWVVIGTKSAMSASVAYGLSLLGILVQAARGNGFPMFWINISCKP